MLRNYSRIVAALGVIFPILLAIVGITYAVKLESFLTFAYFAVPAAVLCVILESYSTLLETTAENQESIKQLVSTAKNNEREAIGRNSSSSRPAAAEFIAVDIESNASKQRQNRRSIYADPKNPHILICPNCKARQSDSNSSCYQCCTPLR